MLPPDNILHIYDRQKSLYARCFSSAEKPMLYCSSAPQWYSDYSVCMSVSVTTRTRRLFLGGNEVKGQFTADCPLGWTGTIVKYTGSSVPAVA